MRLSAKKNSAPIPYRDSKLTRLLQPALEGESKVSIVCNVSASSDAYDETLSTLKFAQRAKKIKQTITRNEAPSSKALITKYQQEIHSLQSKLKDMETRLLSEEKELRGPHMESQLMMLQEEKEIADARLEATLQEKLQLANDLQKLKSFIICAEDVKPQRPIFKPRVNLLHSLTFSQRKFSSAGSDMVESFDSKTDSFLVKGIENIELELELQLSGKSVTVEECLKVIKEQNKVIENFENRLREMQQDRGQDALEEIKRVVEEKDEEIDQLRDELQLCRNNLARMQMSNRLKRFESP